VANPLKTPWLPPLVIRLDCRVAARLAFDGAEEWMRRLNASQGIFKTASKRI
jgi:hypothetical protein